MQGRLKLERASVLGHQSLALPQPPISGAYIPGLAPSSGRAGGWPGWCRTKVCLESTLPNPLWLQKSGASGGVPLTLCLTSDPGGRVTGTWSGQNETQRCLQAPQSLLYKGTGVG